MSRLSLASLALAACSDHAVVVGDLHEVAQLKAIPNRDLDIVFVVDNSPSMADQQAALAANFPRMMDVLGELDGGLPNLHIGVITSDLGTTAIDGGTAPSIGQLGAGGCAGTGDDGRLQNRSARLAGNFIADVDDGTGARRRNYTGALATVFSEIAQVGDTGCGFEQHLAALARSLENPANAGFVRPEANLAVIVIADEDDCSARTSGLFGPDDGALGPLQSFRCARHGVTCDSEMTTTGPKSDCRANPDSALVAGVPHFVDALLANKRDPRDVMVAGIVGDPAPVDVELRPVAGENQLALVPSCTFPGASGPESAEPAVRLAEFLDAFPGRTELTSICSEDLSTPLAAIGATAKKLVGDPCLDTSVLADASPDPGIQPACEVLDIRDSAPDAPRPLPACAVGASATDCFELAADPVACPATPDHLRVRFRRTTVADDTWTSVRCQLR